MEKDIEKNLHSWAPSFALGPPLLPSAKIDRLYLLQYTDRRVTIQEVRNMDKRTVKAEGRGGGG
jgi:hypothetical protein